MNHHLRHLVKRAPGIILNYSGFISEFVDSSEGLKLLKMQHASSESPEVGKWAQVRKGIYKGDVGYITSIKSGRVEILLVPRLSQPKGNQSPSHSCSAPTLFKCEAVNRLYNIQPVEVQENIYSFRKDKFEHGLIIKSYPTDSILMTVSCMPIELFCLFLESHHPTLMAAKSSFPKPTEWFFAEGDEVCTDDNPDKSVFISMLRSDSVELSTEEGIVCVPWLKVCKVFREGDFVEVTGGVHLGWTGWVVRLYQEKGSREDGITFVGPVATIIKIEDRDKLLSDHTQVFSDTV
jgi:transcription elongation factor